MQTTNDDHNVFCLFPSQIKIYIIRTHNNNLEWHYGINFHSAIDMDTTWRIQSIQVIKSKQWANVHLTKTMLWWQTVRAFVITA